MELFSFQLLPIICCCIVSIPICMLFECGAYWNYYAGIDGILTPISIVWSVLAVIILVIPFIVVILAFQCKILVFLFFIPAILTTFAMFIILLYKCYYSVYNYTTGVFLYNLLNDSIFFLFSFKLLSLFLISFIICTAITAPYSKFIIGPFIVSTVIILIVLWILIGKISTQLYEFYEEYASSVSNTTIYIRPLVPFGENNKIYLTTNVNAKSFSKYIIRLWRRYTFWFRHSLLIITCLLTMVTASIKYKLTNVETVKRFALTTIIAASFPIILSIYSVITVFNNEHCKCRKLSFCLSSDVKYRGIIFTKTLLFMLKNYLIEYSGPNLFGYSFAILSFSTLLFIAVMTWAVRSHILTNLPIKNANTFRITYLISYIICKISSFFVVVNSFINCTYIPCTSFIGNVVLPFLWIFWSKLYNNEVARFTSELRKVKSINNTRESYNNTVCGKTIVIESFPSTLGSLYQLQCMIIIGAFMTLVICSFELYQIFIQQNKVGIQYEARISLFFHIFFALIALINGIVALRSIQPRTKRRDKSDLYLQVLDADYDGKHSASLDYTSSCPNFQHTMK